MSQPLPDPVPLTLLPVPAGMPDGPEPFPDVPVPAGSPAPAPEARGAAWATAAVLLRYPDAGLPDDLPGLGAVLGEVAPAVGEAVTAPLRRVVGALRGRPLLAVQAEYVATFDTRRRCCPYLTYYLHGDTRRRGLALWRVKAALRACGVEPADGELPDHLAVLCELAAVGDESVAVALLDEHRAGLALLHAALVRAGSPYAGVVEAVQELLPGGAPTARDLTEAARLATSGPPAELVGLPGHLAPFLPAADDDRGARR